MSSFICNLFPVIFCVLAIIDDRGKGKIDKHMDLIKKNVLELPQNRLRVRLITVFLYMNQTKRTRIKNKIIKKKKFVFIRRSISLLEKQKYKGS